MRFAAAIFVALCAFAYPAMGEPVAYSDVLAIEAASVTPDATNGSSGDTTADTVALNAEQTELMAGDPDWRAHASLYHAGGGGATGNDSLGCRPIAMRTVAVDPRVIPRRTRLFIRETVGMLMPDGSRHDGYWYASDTGGAIKGQRVDLYTGNGRGSMRPAMRFNQRTLTITDAGRFEGCPPATSPVVRQVAAASASAPVQTATLQMASN
ncbi:3D domain-containing protein [soil metagenome]